MAQVTFPTSGISRPSSTPISALMSASSFPLIEEIKSAFFSRSTARLTDSERSVWRSNSSTSFAL